MRAVLSLLRIAVPSRAALVIAIALCCGGARLLAPGSDMTSFDNRTLTIALLEFGLLPVVAAMMGGALVRGEHAAWSWALARPMRRGTYCAVHIVLDVVTLWLGATIVDVVLGDLPSSISYDLFRTLTLGSGLSALETTGAPVVILVAYLAGAFAVSRGYSTLRGFPIALLCVGLVAIVTACAVWLDDAIAHRFLVDAWPTPADAGLLDEPFEESIESLVALAAIAVASLAGFAHVVGRSLIRAPARVPRREVAVVFTLWVVGCAACSWSLRSRLWVLGEAPVLARRGDAQLYVHDRSGHVVLAERNCDSCFARESSGAARRGDAAFAAVSPGAYELCFVREPRRVEGKPTGPRLQSCVDVELTAGDNHLSGSFDEHRAMPLPPRQPRGWERDDLARRLPLLRKLATLLDEVER